MARISGSIEAKLFRSIREAFVEAGVPYAAGDDSAMVLWYDGMRDVFYWNCLRPWQIVNRIPSMNVICRKVPFARVIEKMRRLFPLPYSSFPASFLLPMANDTFMKALTLADKTYIVKPDGGSLGNGIRIIKPGDPYVPSEALAVAQEYVESYLMDDRKFDLRVYVLVASVDPLRVYVYRDGLARFCSEVYSTDSMFAKVSNVTFNRDNPEMEIAAISKLISDTFPQLEQCGVDIPRLWRRIDRVVVLSIVAAYGFLQQAERWTCPPSGYSRCFQILGFDILLDKFLQPRVLEVNYRPNLDYYRGRERRMKVEMIRDALLIAAPYAKLHGAASVRRNTWQKQSWDGFVEAHPELIDAAEKLREETLKRSRFEQAWPVDGEAGKGINKIIDQTLKMPLEYLPGFRLPDHLAPEEMGFLPSKG
jgi:hypothetical protein